jgi:hypothetical protein
MPTPTLGVTSRLISVSAQNNSTWTQRTADISDYIGTTARLVVLYQSGSNFRGDAQLDTFNIGGTTYNPTSNGITINGSSIQTSSGSPSPGADLDDITTEYNSVSWNNVGTNTSLYGRWIRDSGGTPSSSTGNTSGNSGSFYLYAETSVSGQGYPSKWFWLRTPEVTLTTDTLSLYTAQNGVNCGPIYVYLEITSIPDITVTPTGEEASTQIGIAETNNNTITGWGRGSWGSAEWGEPLPVTTTGEGLATAVGSVTVSADATLQPSGLEATGGVGSVTVVADANISSTGESVTGAVGSVTVSADATSQPSGLEATGGIGSVTVGANADVSVTGNQLTQNFSPEYDLTLDGNFPEGQIEQLNNTERKADVLWAGEVQLPSSFSQTECLWEHGGSGIGSWLGVSKILNTYYLRFRAGEGSNAVQDNTPGDICLENVAISSIPEFDGNTHTVAFDIRVNPGRIRLWIDGREVINTSKTTQLEGASWSGGNVGGWGQGYSSIAGGVDTYDSGTTQYQALTAWSGTVASGLRYYFGENADFGADVVVAADANISATGESANALNGSVSITADANVSVTGVGLTSNIGSVTVSANADVSPDGIVANAVTGTGSATGDANVPVTGVLGTSAHGDVTVTGTANISPTGEQANATVGSATVSADANISVTGEQLSSTQGNVTVTGTANISATGEFANTNVGSVTISGDANLSVTGESSSAAQGSVAASANADVPVTGEELGATFGDVTVSGVANVPVTGSVATAQVGTVVVSIPKDVDVVGEQVTASIGDVTITADSDVDVTGEQITISDGTATVAISVTAALTGLSSTVQQGSVEVSGNSTAFPEGLQAIISTSGVNVWGLIDTGQNPNYVAMSTGQSPSYSPIGTTQSPGYNGIDTTQSPSYGPINTSQTPEYTDVRT